jgi:hypothetical protein
MNRVRSLFFGYLFFVFCLFLYSFTQIDLSLTLTKPSFWQEIQRSFQAIGYFNRPLSTGIYLAVVLGMWAMYLLILQNVRSNLFTRRHIFVLSILVTSLLIFSYNAFSYDLFNYIFDAKIVTYYQDNPYLKKALDYPSDPMLSFMRWTHRVYPYGPGWLLYTIPLSYLGMQHLFSTFLLFKIAIGLSFLGSVYYLGKILDLVDRKRAPFAMAFFGLNPLVVIESLVSAHNDAVMMFFALLALYFLITHRRSWGFVSLVFSASIKFVTSFLFPFFLLLFSKNNLEDRKRLEQIFLYMLLAMLMGTVIATARTNFQPWYLLYPLPFAALLTRHYMILLPTIIFSFGTLFHYAPFLFLGNWDPPVPLVIQTILFGNVIISGVAVTVYFLKRKINLKA